MSDTTETREPKHWKVLDVSEIDTWECEPLETIIGSILAKGNFVFVVAQSQTRKTLMALYFSICMLKREKIFDRYPIESDVKKILYFGLEDPDRRFKARIEDIGGKLNLKRNTFIIRIAPGLNIAKKEDFEYFKAVVQYEQADMVFLDTYQKATCGISSFDDEKQTPILHELSNLTRELGITLFCIDHTRKSQHNVYKPKGNQMSDINDVKGSGNKVANADCLIILDKMGRSHIQFQVWNKDFDDPVMLLLKVSQQGSGDQKFTIVKDYIEESATNMVDVKRKEVLGLLNGEWVSSHELVQRLKISSSSVRRIMSSLIHDQLVETNGQLKRWLRYRRILGKIDFGKLAKYTGASLSTDNGELIDGYYENGLVDYPDL